MHKTNKYYCREDNRVAQGACPRTCPYCRQPMTFMGDRWRPGRKNSRTRMWDPRQAGPPRVVSLWRDGKWDPHFEDRDKHGRKHKRADREKALTSVPAYGARARW